MSSFMVSRAKITTTTTMTTTMTTMSSHPYICEVEIVFPTSEHAEQVKSAMEVDVELGDRVRREFFLEDVVMKV